MQRAARKISVRVDMIRTGSKERAPAGAHDSNGHRGVSERSRTARGDDASVGETRNQLHPHADRRGQLLLARRGFEDVFD